jgi:L-alanine-DL-glutamate epimerase-like enolase superfamily enzyme
MTSELCWKAWELGCMDAVALKLSKFGGLSALRRARDLCLHLGAKMCIEVHLGIGHRHGRGAASWGGDRAGIAAQCLRPVRPMSPRDWTPMRRCVATGVSRRRTGNGLGVEPDLSVLGAPAATFD